MKKLILTTAVCLALPLAIGFAEMGHEGHDMGGKKMQGHGSHGQKAKGEDGKSLTVKGEIVDMACYMGHEAKGKKHKKCAAKCILENNQPMGLLTEKGDVYLLVEDHAKQKPYESLKKRAAEIVSLTGDYHTRGGVQAIVVKKVIN